MESSFTILNGAFTATLTKSGTYEYAPTYKKIEKKADKGNEKEKPQYAFIEKSEKEATVNYQKTLKNTVLDIVKFLKTI